MSQFLTIDKQRLIINKLPRGQYNLSFLPSKINVFLDIIKGKEWENENQIYFPEERRVIELKKNPNILVTFENDPKLTNTKDETEV